MKMIVEQYNKHPHKTLSKYAGRKVSPAEVQKNTKLEASINYLIHCENLQTQNQLGYKLREGQKVNIYDVNTAIGKSKYRSSNIPGYWFITKTPKLVLVVFMKFATKIQMKHGMLPGIE